MWHDKGLLDQVIFRCTLHQYWEPEITSNADGELLVLFVPYEWRETQG
jgi:hypothetical protein